MWKSPPSLLNCQDALVPLHNSRETFPPAPVSLELIINCDELLDVEDAPKLLPIQAFLATAKPPAVLSGAVVEFVASVVLVDARLATVTAPVDKLIFARFVSSFGIAPYQSLYVPVYVLQVAVVLAAEFCPIKGTSIFVALE